MGGIKELEDASQKAHLLLGSVERALADTLAKYVPPVMREEALAAVRQAMVIAVDARTEAWRARLAVIQAETEALRVRYSATAEGIRLEMAKSYDERVAHEITSYHEDRVELEMLREKVAALDKVLWPEGHPHDES